MRNSLRSKLLLVLILSTTLFGFIFLLFFSNADNPNDPPLQFTYQFKEDSLGDILDSEYINLRNKSYGNGDFNGNESFSNYPYDTWDSTEDSDLEEYEWFDSVTIDTSCNIHCKDKTDNMPATHRKVLHFEDGSDTAGDVISFEHELDNNETDPIISFWTYRASGTGNPNAGFQLRDEGVDMVSIVITASFFQWYDGTDYNTVQTYTSDMWYHHKFAVDTSSETYDWYIDGKLEGDDLDFVNSISSGIDKFRMYMGYAQDGELWFDAWDGNFTTNWYEGRNTVQNQTVSEALEPNKYSFNRNPYDEYAIGTANIGRGWEETEDGSDSIIDRTQPDVYSDNWGNGTYESRYWGIIEDGGFVDGPFLPRLRSKSSSFPHLKKNVSNPYPFEIYFETKLDGGSTDSYGAIELENGTDSTDDSPVLMWDYTNGEVEAYYWGDNYPASFEYKLIRDDFDKNSVMKVRIELTKVGFIHIWTDINGTIETLNFTDSGICPRNTESIGVDFYCRSSTSDFVNMYVDNIGIYTNGTSILTEERGYAKYDTDLEQFPEGTDYLLTIENHYGNTELLLGADYDSDEIYQSLELWGEIYNPSNTLRDIDETTVDLSGDFYMDAYEDPIPNPSFYFWVNSSHDYYSGDLSFSEHIFMYSEERNDTTGLYDYETHRIHSNSTTYVDESLSVQNGDLHINLDATQFGYAYIWTSINKFLTTNYSVKFLNVKTNWVFIEEVHFDFNDSSFLNFIIPYDEYRIETTHSRQLPAYKYIDMFGLNATVNPDAWVSPDISEFHCKIIIKSILFYNYREINPEITSWTVLSMLIALIIVLVPSIVISEFTWKEAFVPMFILMATIGFISHLIPTWVYFISLVGVGLYFIGTQTNRKSEMVLKI